MPTGPRPGAPSTVNLGSAVIQAMLGDLPHAWLLSIYALIDPITFQTDELCAIRPPDPESWGFNDAMNALDPATNQLAIDKLIRMAKASVWNTYCHEVRPAEDLYVTGPLTWQGDVGGPEMPDILGRPIVDFGVADPLADLWILTTQCFENPTVGNPPQITVSNQDGDVFNVRIGQGYSTAFGMVVTAFNRSTLFPSLDGEAFDLPWPETADRFRLLSNGSDGRWGTSLTAWTLRPVPPTAWAAAPELPTGAQFSEACVAALCVMAGEWSSNMLGQQLLFGAIETARASLEAVDTAGTADVLGAIAGLVDGQQPPQFTLTERDQLAQLAADWPEQLARSQDTQQRIADVRNDQQPQTDQISGQLANYYDAEYGEADTRRNQILQALSALAGGDPAQWVLDWSTSQGPAEYIEMWLDNGSGVFVTIIDIPEYISQDEGIPAKFPRMGVITFGNNEGWMNSVEIEHELSVWQPAPVGTRKFAIQTRPPMRATATIYRPWVPE